ncbi:unnamed protein product [Ceratitis capitata]|uniref:(Mediterranean fruit fly) hypothetical protein n=1 Tax=Ceratitis capitata TaxID=7213 RepID=A0A811UZN5_CERCA|nr:unnamed protein product [Ceratitis capitata]
MKTPIKNLKLKFSEVVKEKITIHKNVLPKERSSSKWSNVVSESDWCDQRSRNGVAGKTWGNSNGRSSGNAILHPPDPLAASSGHNSSRCGKESRFGGNESDESEEKRPLSIKKALECLQIIIIV